MDFLWEDWGGSGPARRGKSRALSSLPSLRVLTRRVGFLSNNVVLFCVQK